MCCAGWPPSGRLLISRPTALRDRGRSAGRPPYRPDRRDSRPSVRTMRTCKAAGQSWSGSKGPGHRCPAGCRSACPEGPPASLRAALREAARPRARRNAGAPCGSVAASVPYRPLRHGVEETRDRPAERSQRVGEGPNLLRREVREHHEGAHIFVVDDLRAVVLGVARERFDQAELIIGELSAKRMLREASHIVDAQGVEACVVKREEGGHS